MCSSRVNRRRCSCFLLATLTLGSFGGWAWAADLGPDQLGQLHYRALGVRGNRTAAVVGVPGDPLVYYAGAASGGIWKTADGGVHWKPVFDDQDVAAIGALAVAPLATNEVWAGTGETFYIRPMTSMGNGIYKSTDGGDHWQHMGLEKTGRIGVIVVDPGNPNVVFACAAGDGFGPQQDRGVYRTEDGGKSWKRVLFVNPETGCSDLSMDPNDSKTLFAGTWQWTVKPWNLNSGGPGSGIYVSHDGGTSWERVQGNGFPTTALGKTSVAVAASDSRRVYALLQGAGLYRSDDGGNTWKQVNQSHHIMERPTYYTRVRVAPDDKNKVYFPQVRFMMSSDGGDTVADQKITGDNHDVWMDPKNPKRMIVAYDQGVTISLNRFKTWQTVFLPIAQVYHVYTDNAVPYNVYGNRQDGGSYRGPSDSLRPSNVFSGGGINAGLWSSVGGCESGFAVPLTDTTGYSGCYAGGLQYYDVVQQNTRDIEVWPMVTYGWPPAEVKLRWNWTFPIAISPFTKAVYVGSQFVHESTNRGQSWKTVSPDLTRNDKARQQNSGGITTDNLMTFSPETLSAIALSAVKQGVIWAGSYDGLVHVSMDNGQHWSDVTKGLPGLQPWGKISNIDPSHREAGGAYISVDRSLMGDYTPYIYKTNDYGRHWIRITKGIPDSKLNYVHVVVEDPVRQGMLYAGTENNIYFSLDDGLSWLPLQTNLPHTPVYWITVQPERSDLVVATYGRGIWILDDVTPLREMNAKTLDSDVHLFAPRSAYRFQDKMPVLTDPDDPVKGYNPPGRADFNYYLKSAPRGEVRLAVYDAAGKLVRSFSSSSKGAGALPAKVGINRLWWDMRYAPVATTKLKLPPPDAPWVKPTGPDGNREIVTWMRDSSRRGPVVAPGTYTVKLTVNGESVSAPLVVMKDPGSEGTIQDVQQQVALALGIRDSLDHVVAIINDIEVLRSQLAMLKSTATYTDVAKPAEALNKKLLAVEGQLVDVKLTGAGEDPFRNPMRLYGRLSALLEQVGNQSADYLPTDQHRQVFGIMNADVKAQVDAFAKLNMQDVPALNRVLKAKGMADIGLPAGGM